MIREYPLHCYPQVQALQQRIVDARLLKAAAIEHSKDPDGAAEFILTEVIPHTTKKFDASSSISETLTVASSASSSSSKDESTASCNTAIGTEVMKKLNYIEPPCLNERDQDPFDLTFYDAKDFSDQMSGNAGNKKCTTSKTWERTHQESSVIPRTKDIDNGDFIRDPKNINYEGASELKKYRDLDLSTLALSASSASSLPKDAVSTVSLSSKNCGSDCDLISFDSNIAAHSESEMEQPSCDSDFMYGSNVVKLALLSVKDQMQESSIQSNVESVTSGPKLGFSERSCNDDTTFREDIQVFDNANPDESYYVHSIVPQSLQVCNTELLEYMIEESKGHKKSLFSDIGSVLKLMKDVASAENAVEQSKKEASERGLEIRAKVGELKSMLNCARETNDMHSGEVHGERAILATEMKELESRLLSLSDVKEKSLSVLDVMQKTLETRISAAELERTTAEREKYKRGESDRKFLAELELVMEKVVEESKILQHEAEENARLQELLVDRGRLVDILQGEIYVICQDVKFLKEKFDKGLLRSQSVSSSGSVRKSTDSDQLHRSSIVSADPLLLPSVKQTTAFSQKGELLDEGWELFEDEDYQ